MRLWIPATSLLASLLGVQGTPQPIFREVRLVGDTIRLGRPWPGATRLGISAQDSVASLPRGAFGWAEGIQIHRDRAAVVRQIDFTYGPQRDFHAMLREYRVSLGTPVDSSRTAEGGQRRDRWVWRDGQTEFALARFVPTHNGVQARSTLTDRTHR